MKKILMKKHYLVILVSAVFLSLGFQNCSQLGRDDLTSGSNAAIPENQLMMQKAMKVLSDNCASCHNSEITQNGVDLTNLDDMLVLGVVIPNEPALSPLMHVIEDPQIAEHGALKQKDINTLSAWITDGFKAGGSGTGPTGDPIPLGPTWTSINENIISRRCTGCHNNAQLSGGVSFQTYAGVLSRVTNNTRDPNAALIYRRVAGLQGVRMPLNGLPLTAEELAAISTWIMNGAPQN